MARLPGTPTYLRAMNDRHAFERLLAEGPLTRGRLGELTGLSKVTASQLVARLAQRGLVEVVGTKSGGRGPSAELYAVRADCRYAVGVDSVLDRAVVAIADIAGNEVARASRPTDERDDPAAVIPAMVRQAMTQAGVDVADVDNVVIGATGVVDPDAGDVTFSFDLRQWHRGLHDALSDELACEVTMENNVNLAAVAERHQGAAQDVAHMVLFWVGRGVGAAVVLGDHLQRGATGAVGEVGFLPVPGAPVPPDVESRDSRGGLSGSLQQLIGASAVSELAEAHGIAAEGAAEAVRAALAAGAPADGFLAELARRIALGVAAVCAVVDPALVVLAGSVGSAADEQLCKRISDEVAHVVPVRPTITRTAVESDPVLRGALITAVDKARANLLAEISAD